MPRTKNSSSALWGIGGSALQDYLYGSDDTDSLLTNYSGTQKADSGTDTGADATNSYQTSAISSNAGQVSDIAALTKSINDILQTGQFNANYSRIPQEYQLETKSSANIADALSGKVSQDVIDQLATQAAERGVSSGSPLGASTNADYLKALGLTSTGLQNTGQSWLNAATGRNPAAQTMDPTTMLVTPTQQAQQSLAEQELALKERELELEQQRISNSKLNVGGTGNYRGGGGGSFGGTNNYSSLNPYATGSKGTGTTSTSSSYNPDTWYDWENEFWNGTNVYDTGGNDESAMYTEVPTGTYYDPVTDTSNYAGDWYTYLGDLTGSAYYGE